MTQEERDIRIIDKAIRLLQKTRLKILVEKNKKIATLEAKVKKLQHEIEMNIKYTL